MMTAIIALLILSQLKVGDITITGNTFFTTREIKVIMLTRTPGLFRRGTFKQEILTGDLVAVTNLYQYEGFLEAVVVHELTVDTIKPRVEIYIDITEGQQTIVKAVEFTGNTVFADSALHGKITIHPLAPFDRRKVDLDKNVITALYDDIGYADVTVQVDHGIIDHKAHITYQIQENEKQYVEKIEFIGLRRTDERILQKEISLKHGDIFRYASILKSQRKLYNLGSFRSVRAQVSSGDLPNSKIVQFHLAEKKSIHFFFRIGYGTRDYLRLGAGVEHINMFGRAWHGEIDSKWSFTEYYLSSKLSFPRLLFLPVRTGVGVFYKYKEEIGFNTRNVGGNITAHWRVLEGTFTTQYSLENIRTYYTDETIQEEDWLQGITFNWLKDRRNDPLFTRSGDYMNILFETSGIIFPSAVDYIKLLFDYRLYKPLGVFVGAFALRTGIIEPVSPTTEIPVYKRYYCGGTSSVRGYAEWSIGPLDASGNPLGGRILAEISGEFRFPIYKIVGGVLFYDGGNIWQDYSDVNGELRYGVGGGLRVKTPFGSVRLDYGFKIRRQPDESPGALHFAIGEAF